MNDETTTKNKVDKLLKCMESEYNIRSKMAQKCFEESKVLEWHIHNAESVMCLKFKNLVETLFMQNEASNGDN